jgi:MFS family permease
MIRAMQAASAPSPRLRSRALTTYFVAVALTSIAYIATFTVASLAAPEITGFAGSSGWPSATSVAGTAVAATLLSSVMARRDRRAGIVLGIGVAVLSGALAIAAVALASLPLLLLASAGVGFGNAAMNLTRYAAAELYPVAQRAGVLSVIVWGSTFGAVLGPNLVGPAGSLAPSFGLAPLAGGFALALAFLAAALTVAALGPRAPARPPESASAGATPRLPARRLLVKLLGTPRGRMAIAALLSGQLVMTLIMTMTPYHLHEHGHGLGTIGFVISAHTLGMFAFSPLSGRLTDRFGPGAIITAGFAVLALAGGLSAVTPAAGGDALAIPLLLLGLGWNLSFVSGSALLASEATTGGGARLQGASDALVWVVAAAASFSSGFVVAVAGYAFLSFVGAGLAVTLAVAIRLDARFSRPMPA